MSQASLGLLHTVCLHDALTSPWKNKLCSVVCYKNLEPKSVGSSIVFAATWPWTNLAWAYSFIKLDWGYLPTCPHVHFQLAFACRTLLSVTCNTIVIFYFTFKGCESISSLHSPFPLSCPPSLPSSLLFFNLWNLNILQK